MCLPQELDFGEDGAWDRMAKIMRSEGGPLSISSVHGGARQKLVFLAKWPLSSQKRARAFPFANGELKTGHARISV
jgi:hypothetical protein